MTGGGRYAGVPGDPRNQGYVHTAREHVADECAPQIRRSLALPLSTNQHTYRFESFSLPLGTSARLHLCGFCRLVATGRQACDPRKQAQERRMSVRRTSLTGV